MPLSIGQHRWGNRIVTVYETDKDISEDRHTVVLRTGPENLAIAAWDGTGRLSVENGWRTVKRLLSDHGIGPALRELCPAIFSDGKLAAVFGAGTDLSLQAQSSRRQLVITLEQVTVTPDIK